MHDKFDNFDKKIILKQGVAKHDQLLPDVTGCGRSPCLHDCHAFRSHCFLQRLASTKFHRNGSYFSKFTFCQHSHSYVMF